MDQFMHCSQVNLCLLFLCDKVGSIGVQFNPTLTRSWHQLCCPTPSFLLKIVQLCSVKSATIGNFFFLIHWLQLVSNCVVSSFLKEKKKLNNFFCVNFMLVTRCRIDSPGDWNPLFIHRTGTAQAATVRAFPTPPRPCASTLTWRDHL